jgi:formate hydrogenlyase transcriptional activator
MMVNIHNSGPNGSVSGEEADCTWGKQESSQVAELTRGLCMAVQLQRSDEIFRPSLDRSFGIEAGAPEQCATNQAECGRGFPQILGDSAPLQYVLSMVRIVGPADATVLITGETGTGKELIAQAIHSLSHRSSGPFVKVNCAAIPAPLLESELFGHERGAFTGAIAQRIGRFELANRGTLFLDEVGEIPFELQVKLLRVLQEREFERLGSSRTLQTGARVIAATNRNLSAMVNERQFRADLYYRLAVFPIELSPLRDRREDIPPLVRHFVQRFSRRMNKNIDTIRPDTMEALIRYDWPGNVRELQNIIERAVILSNGPVLTLPTRELQPSSGTVIATNKDSRNLCSELNDMERQRIVAALEKARWKVSGSHGAAALLGIKRSTLLSRMKRLGISVSRKLRVVYPATPCSALSTDYD